ncbi:MAG: hypothetical protein ACTHLE_24840 [Agriterribacter sp.]
MKEYLLLRNNAQSGPYTLDELRVMGLRAYDLVWVENKSFSWKYPSEISELAAFAPALDELQSEPFNIDKTHVAIDLDDLARVLPSAKKEGKKIIAEEAPVRHINHIVALKPKIDHIEIKTVKSVSQPNIVNVQVREREKEETASLQETIEYSRTEERLPDMNMQHERWSDTVSNQSLQPEANVAPANVYFNEPVAGYSQAVANNKLELVVLAIGAISLLAVIYLLLTTGYQY